MRLNFCGLVLLWQRVQQNNGGGHVIMTFDKASQGVFQYHQNHTRHACDIQSRDKGSCVSRRTVYRVRMQNCWWYLVFEIQSSHQKATWSMAVIIDMKAALVKQRKSRSHGTRHIKKVAGTMARRHHGTMAPRHASRHKLNVSRLESRGNITVLPLSFTTKSKVWTGGQICTSTNTLYSPSNICARQSLDYLNSEYLQLFAFGRGMNYGFWCFGSNVLVRMCRSTSSDNDSRCSRFLWDGTNGAVFKWRKPLFYCWHKFFFRQKRRRSRGLQIKSGAFQDWDEPRGRGESWVTWGWQGAVKRPWF